MGTASWTVALYDWARLVFAGPLQEAVVCRAAAAAFLVLARCLVGQMPHATFVGALRVTIKGLHKINSNHCVISVRCHVVIFAVDY